METIIRVRDLSYVYGANTPLMQTALHNIDLDIEQGEILGVIGHTGSGKSTLIQHLNGLLTPSEGEITFRGTPLNASKEFARDVRFHVGLVFQYPEYQLFEETVYRDIAFGPKNMGLSEAEIDMRVREAAASVGLDDALLDKSPFELSGGQKRRVAIAGVVAMRPDVLVLDEPTAGLDPHGRENILRYIKDYNQRTGATVLFVTHSMEDIAQTADRILVMREGRVLMTGSPEEIFSQAEILESAGLSIPQVTRVVRALRAGGIPIDPALYTVEQARDAILAFTRGGGMDA